MKEFFEIINNTPGERLFWYCIFILLVLGGLANMIVSIVTALTNRKKKITHEIKAPEENKTK